MASRKNESKEPYQPMGASIGEKDRLEALDARVSALEREVRTHKAYHFGRESS